MEQHAVPRQITTFEFKLIGFLTVKQFIYLLIFGGFAVLAYFAIPVKYVNALLAIMIMTAGGFISLYKYNERELDVWIKNIIVSLLAPSQYYYMKKNTAPDFLKGVFISGDIKTVQTHIDANQKLSKYMGSHMQAEDTDQKKQHISAMFHQRAVEAVQNSTQNPAQIASDPSVQTAPTAQATPGVKGTPQAFLSGLVHNNKNDLLPNIMVYINSGAQQVVRILKTNHHGLFATFHPLPPGDYTISPKDLGGKYFFDTMNITIDDEQLPPVEIYSREVL